MGNKVSAILKEKRKELGLSVKTVLDMLQSYGVDISDKTLYGWESGHRQPDADTFLALCQIYGIDTLKGIKKAPLYSSEAMKLAQDYDDLDSYGQRVVRLVADEEKARCAEQAQDIRQEKEVSEPDNVIYITRWFSHPMSAGTGTEAGDDYPEELELTKRPPRGTSYVAPVSGNSMEPTYRDGDKLFIRSCEEIDVGQIGVFLMDGKQWVKEQGDGVLVSHNTDYDPIPMRDDIRCQGLVLGVCDESYFE